MQTAKAEQVQVEELMGKCRLTSQPPVHLAQTDPKVHKSDKKTRNMRTWRRQNLIIHGLKRNKTKLSKDQGKLIRVGQPISGGDGGKGGCVKQDET